VLKEAEVFVLLCQKRTRSELRAVVPNLFAEGAQCRLTTLLNGPTKEISVKVIWHILIHSRKKPVTQNSKGFIERLLRAAQRVLGDRMPPTK